MTEYFLISVVEITFSIIIQRSHSIIIDRNQIPTDREYCYILYYVVS